MNNINELEFNINGLIVLATLNAATSGTRPRWSMLPVFPNPSLHDARVVKVIVIIEPFRRQLIEHLDMRLSPDVLGVFHPIKSRT